MAYGFRPVSIGGTGGGDARTNTYANYEIAQAFGTDLLKGDPVTVDTNGNLIRAAVDTPVVGVFAGCQYETTVGVIRNIFGNFIAADVKAGNAQAIVWDDPQQIFEIESDNVGTAFVAADIQENADFVVKAGSVFTGVSGFDYDSSAGGGTATAQMRLLGPGEQDTLARVFPTVGTPSPIRIRFNEHQNSNTVGV